MSPAGGPQKYSGRGVPVALLVHVCRDREICHPTVPSFPDIAISGSSFSGPANSAPPSE